MPLPPALSWFAAHPFYRCCGARSNGRQFHTFLLIQKSQNFSTILEHRLPFFYPYPVKMITIIRRGGNMAKSSSAAGLAAGRLSPPSRIFCTKLFRLQACLRCSLRAVESIEGPADGRRGHTPSDRQHHFRACRFPVSDTYRRQC